MSSPTQIAHQARPAQLSLLDACRGAAALWVVIFHASVAYVVNGHHELLANPVYAFAVQGQIGVGFFFAISGYCILATIYNGMLRSSTLLEYFVARWKRIYPPYLVALCCVVVVHFMILLLMSRGVLQGARPPDSPLDHSLVYWVANVALLQLPAGYTSYLAISWSLCYEIMFYVLAGGLWWMATFVSRSQNRMALLVTLLNSCSMLSLVWLTSFRSTCPFPLNRWYQFGLGIAMFVLVNRRNLQLARSLQIQSIVVIMTTLAYAWHSSPVKAVDAFFAERTLVLCVLGFVLVVTALARFDRQLAGHWLVVQFRKLGTISYSLYLFHMIPMPFVDAVLRRVGLEGSLYLVNVAAQTVTALIAGTLFHQLVEKRFSVTKKRFIEAGQLQCQPSI